MATSGLRRVTLDFDGSVLSTGRFAEGTAAGFNPRKKGQRRWNTQYSYFEHWWAPKSWNYKYRFIFIRSRHTKRDNRPVQLNLFRPGDPYHDHRVVITNKTLRASKVIRFYHGRGAQEGLFGELKSQIQMDYVPTRRQAGNRIYVLAAILAHNLNRELHMIAHRPCRKTSEKRAPLWSFERLDTLRHKIIQRAGRLTRPKGQLKLTMSANEAVRSDLLHILGALGEAA